MRLAARQSAVCCTLHVRLHAATWNPSEPHGNDALPAWRMKWGRWRCGSVCRRHSLPEINAAWRAVHPQCRLRDAGRRGWRPRRCARCVGPWGPATTVGGSPLHDWHSWVRRSGSMCRRTSRQRGERHRDCCRRRTHGGRGAAMATTARPASAPCEARVKISLARPHELRHPLAAVRRDTVVAVPSGLGQALPTARGEGTAIGFASLDPSYDSSVPPYSITSVATPSRWVMQGMSVPLRACADEGG